MKKYVSAFLLFSALIIGTSGYAQRVNPHTIYPAAADVRYELNTKGERLGVSLVLFLGNEAYLKGGMVLENTDVFRLFRGKKDFNIKEYRSTLAQFGYYHKILNANDFAFLNVGGSAIFGTEKILREGDLQETSKALFAVSPGVETEVYLADNFAIVGSFHYMFTLNSDVYKYDPFFGLGLRVALKGPGTAPLDASGSE